MSHQGDAEGDAEGDDDKDEVESIRSLPVDSRFETFIHKFIINTQNVYTHKFAGVFKHRLTNYHSRIWCCDHPSDSRPRLKPKRNWVFLLNYLSFYVVN